MDASGPDGSTGCHPAGGGLGNGFGATVSELASRDRQDERARYPKLTFRAQSGHSGIEIPLKNKRSGIHPVCPRKRRSGGWEKTRLHARSGPG